MDIIKNYIYVFLPILIAIITAFKWNEAISFFPYIMLFLFFVINEIGNFFISNNQFYGVAFYINYFRYEDEIKPANKTKKIKLISLNINRKIIGFIFILLSIVFYLYLIFNIQLDLFYYLNLFFLIVIYYFIPKLDFIKKDYLNIGLIFVVINALLFLSFYFIDLTSISFIVLNILFILLLLEFNIFLFLNLADKYLIETKYKLKFYKIIKKYNHFYGLILLIVYSLFTINLTLTNNIIWIIPLFTFPYIFYLFSNFTKMINQGKISLNRLKVFHWRNIKIYIGGSLIIIFLLLLDIII
ncbi:MAG: hypothetical protein ACOCVD_02975 [Bacillota bacterium]